MKITCKNSFMIIEHPSGVISKYSKTDIEKWQAWAQADINESPAVKSNFDLQAIEIEGV